jgi:hypothetical protein
MGFVPTGHRPIKSRHFYQAGDNEKKKNVLINTTAASPPKKNNARNHNEKFNIPTAMFTG